MLAAARASKRVIVSAQSCSAVREFANKSAASAASLGPRKNPNHPRKNREKIKDKLPFCVFYIGNPVVRSEIGSSGSEKKLCTLLGSKS